MAASTPNLFRAVENTTGNENEGTESDGILNVTIENEGRESDGNLNVTIENEGTDSDGNLNVTIENEGRERVTVT